MPIVSTFGVIERIEDLKLLGRFHDLARFDTAGADLHPTVAASGKLNANGLQIRIEPTPGLVVSVRNIVSKLRAFTANITSLSHNFEPPSIGDDIKSY